MRQKLTQFVVSVLLSAGFGAGVTLAAESPPPAPSQPSQPSIISPTSTPSPEGTQVTNEQPNPHSGGGVQGQPTPTQTHNPYPAENSAGAEPLGSNPSVTGGSTSTGSSGNPSSDTVKKSDGTVKTEKTAPAQSESGVNNTTKPLVYSNLETEPAGPNFHPAIAPSSGSTVLTGLGSAVAVTRFVQQRLALNQLPVTPIPAAAPILPAPHPSAPTLPFNGILQQIQGLIAVFIPVPANILNLEGLATGFPAVVIILAVFFFVSLNRVMPTNIYTSRLRRSGYLGAPRSDVAAFLTFATPLKWVVSVMPVQT